MIHLRARGNQQRQHSATHESDFRDDALIWDDPKNDNNINDRKIDFADLDDIFDGRFAIVTEDTRRDYGERRFNMLAEIGGLILNVTFTMRPSKNRIISARIASRKERRTYHTKSKDS